MFCNNEGFDLNSLFGQQVILCHPKICFQMPDYRFDTCPYLEFLSFLLFLASKVSAVIFFSFCPPFRSARTNKSISEPLAEKPKISCGKQFPEGNTLPEIVGSNFPREIPCQKTWGTISRGKYPARKRGEQFPAGNTPPENVGRNFPWEILSMENKLEISSGKFPQWKINWKYPPGNSPNGK